MKSSSKIEILVPVYNEGENARVLYNSLLEERVDFDKLTFVYDFDTDTTIQVVKSLIKNDNRVFLEQNKTEPGVLNALKWGFSKATKDGALIVVMGDNSDKLSIIPIMVRLWESGATIVCPSRYTKGGKQHGGGLIKSNLSKLAGKSLKFFGFPISDPTNNFKLYDTNWLQSKNIESTGGFEIAIELCFKAYKEKKVIEELPTEWFDRVEGESNFKLLSWLPKYLKWYLKILKTLIV